MKLQLFFALCLATVVMGQDVDVNTYVLLSEDAEKRVHVPTEKFDRFWRRSLDYDDSEWMTCSGTPGGIGYETETGYENLISLDVRQSMFGAGSTCLVRIKFYVTEEQLEKLWKLEFIARYDDGFVAYINNRVIAYANTPQGAGSPESWKFYAPESHEALDAEVFDASGGLLALQPGENLLTIQAFNDTINSPDFLITAQLVAKEYPVFHFESTNLPLVYIDTHGQEILNNQKITAHMGSIYHGVGNEHRRNEPINDYDGQIGIEIRGMSSAGYPKKQYGFETRNENGSNNNVSLMGLPKENDWILFAPYLDKTFLRNVLTYDLARCMGHYASRTRYCELFLNGRYRGLYVLMEKIKRDSNRVNIARLDSTMIEGDELTGGYIIKLDKGGDDGFESRFTAANGKPIFYQFHYPQDDQIVEPQKQYIEQFMHDFESKMANESKVAAGEHLNWIDLDSFVDFFLISEFAKNIDSYRLSTFLHKDRDSINGKLHMGPVWDYNNAYGSTHQFTAPSVEGWALDVLLDTTATPFWWRTLRHDPHFQQRLKTRWQELSNDAFDISRIHSFINNVADTLETVKDRNFFLWSRPGEPCESYWPVPDTMKTFTTYEDELNYLKRWIQKRIAWMDENIKLISEVNLAETHLPSDIVLLPNYPNPFNGSTQIQFRLPQASYVELNIFNLQGQIVRILANRQFPNGHHQMLWDGQNDSGQMLASGVYTCRLQIKSGDETETYVRKMLMVK